MSLFDTAIDFISSTISIILVLLCYNKIAHNGKLHFNIKNIIIIILSSILLMLNAYYIESLIRSFISIIIMFICTYFVIKNGISETFISILVSYVFIALYEVVLSLLFMSLNIVNMDMFDKNSLLKAMFSIITLLLVYLTIRNKRVNKIIDKIIHNAIVKYIGILLSLICIVLILLDFKYSQYFSFRVYISNIVLIICLSLIIYITIYSYLKAEKEKEKTELLLNFLSKYEKVIDDNRVSRHELLNTLLALKSIKNKNSKEFDKELDNLIDSFTNKGIKVKNIYKLPSGLKGIFYYKLYKLEEENYNINIQVSKNASKYLKELGHNDYITLYKMVGIVLDNAIEASNKTKNKFIVVDIFEEKETIVIEINNSYKGHINLDKINDKYYSTKGKNRG